MVGLHSGKAQKFALSGFGLHVIVGEAVGKVGDFDGDIIVGPVAASIDKVCTEFISDNLLGSKEGWRVDFDIVGGKDGA